MVIKIKDVKFYTLCSKHGGDKNHFDKDISCVQCEVV